MKRSILAVFLAVALASQASAADDVVSGQIIDLPGMDQPSKGSIGGVISSLSFDGAGINQGNLSLPLPTSFPSNRGPLLLSPVPVYSQSYGQSEYGLGWKQNICIERTRLTGELDFVHDKFSTPFGLMTIGADGVYYPYNLTSRYRLEDHGTELVVYSPDGVTYKFGGDASESGSRGIFRYCMTEASDRFGFGTRFQYYRNATGRLFLNDIYWGAPDVDWEYHVHITLTPLAHPVFVDYKAGVPRAMDQRATQIELFQKKNSEPTLRFSYTLAHKNIPTSSGFYLDTLQKRFAGGAAEPPIKFKFGEWKPDQINVRTSDMFSSLTSELGFVYLDAKYIGLADFDDNGLLGFEYNQTRERFINRGDSFERESTWTEGWDLACGRKGKLGQSRYFQKMQGTGQETNLITFATRTDISYDLIICSKQGQVLFKQPMSGVLGKTGFTHIKDMNRDGLPDLVSLNKGFLRIYENRSDASGFNFFALPTIDLDKSLGESVSFWVADFNGDGIQDIIVKMDFGFKVFFGQGNYQFSKAVGYPSLTNTNQSISVRDYSVSMVDINKDGLKDIVLTSSSGFRVLFQMGQELRESPGTGQVFYQGANQGRPIVGSFDKAGGTQIALADGKGKVKLIDLTQPQSGLLMSYSDGIGGAFEINYLDAYPQAGLGSRTVVVKGIRFKAIGTADRTENWDFSSPALSSLNGLFMGFSKVVQSNAHKVATTLLDIDEYQGPLPLEITTLDVFHRLSTTKTVEYETGSLQEVSSKRPKIQRLSMSKNGASFEISAQAFQYEGACVSGTSTVNIHGMLSEVVEFDTPSELSQFNHCLPKHRNISGKHSEAWKNFDYDFVFKRNSLGQPEDVLQNQRLVQHLRYDSLGRIKEAYSPASGTTTFDYWKNTKELISKTSPDGTQSRIEDFDEINDLPKKIALDRNGFLFEKYFSYQENELLASNWDNVTNSSLDSPLTKYGYEYPSESELGLITTTQKGDSDQSILTKSFIDGTGSEKARLSYGKSWYSDWIKDTFDEGYSDIQKKIFSTFTDADLDQRLVLTEGGTIKHEVKKALASFAPRETTHLVQAGVKKTTNSAVAVGSDGVSIVTSENARIDDSRREDGAGHVLSRKLPEGQSYSYTYDALGRIRQAILPSGVKHSVYFDAWGKISDIDRSDVGKIHYQYDNEGNLVQHTISGQDGKVISDYSISKRDSAKRILVATKSSPGFSRTNSYTYDGALPGGKTNPSQLGFLSSTSNEDFTKTFLYRVDGALEVEEIAFKSGVKLRHSIQYTASGKVSNESIEVLENGTSKRKVTQIYSYNNLDRLESLSINGTEVARAQYDDLGRLAAVNFPKNGSRSHGFDPETGNVNEMSYAGSKPWTYGWSYDDRSFVETESYIFDGVEKSRSLTYDRNGYLKASSGIIEEAFSYPVDGLVKDFASIGRDSIGRVPGKPGKTYVFGGLGEIVGLKEKPSLSWIYDEGGQLLAKQDGERLVYAKFSGFVIKGDFSVVKPLVIDGVAVGYIDNDVVHPALVDNRSTLVEKGGFDSMPSAYGQQMQQSGDADLWGFAQTIRDEDLGLLRMGQRFYDPGVGLFISPDPYFLENLDKCVGSPTECNLYSYARNNPYNYIDPSGTEAEDAFANRYDQLIFEGRVDDAKDLVAGRAELTAWIMGTLEDLKPLPELLTLGGFAPLREAVQSVAQLFGRRASVEVAESAALFLKAGAGSNPENFISVHSEKHLFDPARISTPNRSQYGADIDVKALRLDTINSPDNAYSDIVSKITKYEKSYDFNISTPDTPTGANRVFINNENPARSTQFPYVPRD